MTDTAVALKPDQIDLITRTVAKGCSKDELALFLHACQKTGLDPLMKQIYAVKRGNTITVQTGIDGLRLVAERTGRYAPGREPSFTYLEGQTWPVSATAYIKKLTADGTWHEVAATARYEEYCPGGNFWTKMPHVMIAKVAEALALRRAFPMELSGIYSADEMAQADYEQAAKEKFPRLRGANAAPPVVVVEPVADGSGEARGTGGDAGGGGSETAGRAAVSDRISEHEHGKLRARIREYAKAKGKSEEEVTTNVKARLALNHGIEHLRDITPAILADLERRLR